MGLFGKPKHKELTAAQLKAMLDRGEAQVVDVREPDEFVQGHIPGALNMPLSSFSPASLPDSSGKTLVLNCLGGKRSGLALDQCDAAKSAVDTHLAGGFGAWAQAGLPVER
ncbi:MAG: sulfurtransferase [Sphingomonadales bacterium 63-6]|nr:MAG: sulfurtransferase [Sphingomonadales bacterium 63-6]